MPELTEEMLFARIGNLVILNELQGKIIQEKDEKIAELEAEKNGSKKDKVDLPAPK